MTLTMSFSNYPAQFTPAYTDSNVTWNITIINPCLTTSLSSFGTLTAMTAYVLGGPVYEAFTDITDTISTTYDSINYAMTHYTVAAPFSV